jgi:hypothetical protein
VADLQGVGVRAVALQAISSTETRPAFTGFPKEFMSKKRAIDINSATAAQHGTLISLVVLSWPTSSPPSPFLQK